MALVVQKYGGTSVGSVERIQAVANRISLASQRGDRIVVVVSAMGKTTDTLVKLANEISSNPSSREMDMLLSTGEQVTIALLSMALQELGQPAISLTGAQVGIVTEAEHSRARILQVCTDRIERHLNKGEVVVVAGFQGVSNSVDLEITTLGRGGSDTSAVALAASLKADRCEIYTDVPGILTTDPRLVPSAQLMPEITADEMLELASLGAKVLHPRAVEIARNYGMPLVVLSSWSDRPGTRVISPLPQPRSLQGMEIAKAVDGVEVDRDQAKIALLRVPDCPGVAASLFGEISTQNIDVDLIIQSIHEGNTNDIAFTVVNRVVKAATAVAEAIAPALRTDPKMIEEAEVIIDQQIAKVAISGAGMIGRPGIAAKMFRTLADANINIQMISTSEVKVSCVINESECDHALHLLSQAFDVDLSEQKEIKSSQSSLHSNLQAVSEVSAGEATSITPEKSNSLEQPATAHPPVRGVALDTDQARIAIRNVPDTPGMAAKIFTLLARKNISVDTIIQSQRCHIIDGLATRDIAFTVDQSNAELACEIIAELDRQINCGQVSGDTAIAKLSVVGAGMIGQPGVASKFFAALAQENINIQMITTSEIKISCVIEEQDGIKALQAVHEAFGLGGEEQVTIPA